MRKTMCLLSLLSLSSTAQAHFFASPMARQTSEEGHVGGIQWSATKSDVPLEDGQGSIDQKTITVPGFSSKDDWLYFGGFAALSYNGKSNAIKTATSNTEQNLYGFGAGLQLIAEKDFFEILTGGASVGYSAAFDDGRKSNFKMVTQETMTRIFVRHEVSVFFVPTVAAELARPSRKISYKDADNPVERSTLPEESRQHFYFGFTSEFKGIELGLTAVIGDRRGFYVTLINKP